MLAQRLTPTELAAALVPRESWHPYPTAAERQPWEAIPASARQAHLDRAAQALAEPIPILPATSFLEFARNGNRNRYERVYFARRTRLCDLTVAECLEGQGRFVDGIVDLVWAIGEETYWGVPAHVGMQRAGVGLPDATEPTVDLFVGETAALLAWTIYLLGPRLDAVSPLIVPRVLAEVERRVLVPCLQHEDFWWMGFDGRSVNNWNPWCNSNWLTTALLLERDPERRLAAVAKSIRSIDRFLDPYPRDGGCDEGPGYWSRAGASLFDCLELLHGATNGRLDLYGEPLVGEIGRYIYRVQISGRYFVNFADAPALVSPSASLVYRYGQRLGDERLSELGAWCARQQDLLHRGVSDSIGRQLPALLGLAELTAAPAQPPLPREAWFPEIQVMVARDREGDDAGFQVAAKGGHNAESHNHNDVGHFIVHLDGRPVVVDAGVEAYTAKTFSSRRYEIWTMQSAYHALPTINGAMQAPGREFAARDVAWNANDRAVSLSLNLAGAYPAEARLRSWKRTVRLRRGECVEIEDAYVLEAAVPEISLGLLTPCDAVVESPGRIKLGERSLADDRVSGTAVLTYPADRLAATVEVLDLEDPGLQRTWGGRLCRLVLRASSPSLTGGWLLRFGR
ncbi:MAG: heparinase II/III family protein [Candidatus Latescibacterota bacterium]|jgi:hypothetical protein